MLPLMFIQRVRVLVTQSRFVGDRRGGGGGLGWWQGGGREERDDVGCSRM